jgi:hypothetical protein
MRSAALLILVAAACSKGPLPWQEEPPAPAHQLPAVYPHDGTAIANPHLVSIVYPGYVHAADVATFGDFIVSSSWLGAAKTDFGVGSGSNTNVTLAVAAPSVMNDADLAKQLADLVTNAIVPQPDGETIYMFYIPQATTLYRAGGLMCTQLAGYHELDVAGGQLVPMAVVADCDGTIENVTRLASHELIEAVTDPTYNGWYVDGPADSRWANAYGQEVADLCQFGPNTTEGGWTVERYWSPLAAASGANPCVPAGDDVYKSVTANGSDVLRATPGQTLTIELTGWATGPTPPWQPVYEATDADVSIPLVSAGAPATMTLTLHPDAVPGTITEVDVDSGNEMILPLLVEATLP